MNSSQRSLDEHQRATLLDRLFRRIGSLDDRSLLRLEDAMNNLDEPPTLPKPPKPTPAPIKQSNPDQVSRRYFLATLAAGTVLAAGAGGAAAVALNDPSVRQWLAEQGWVPTGTPAVTAGPSLTPSATMIPTLPPQAVDQIIALQNQIAALTAERDRLRDQVVSLGGQVNDASGQISTLQASNDSYKNLIDLYQQLEAVGLDTILGTALGSMGLSVLAVNTVKTALNSGIVIAIRALETVERQMPLIATGLDWLDQKVLQLAAGITAFKTALEVTDAGSTARSVSDFISQVLDMLPFGAGQNVKTALQAMGNVISQLPELLDNVNVQVIRPARAWVGSGNAGGLYDLLLNPIRQQLLNPAQQIVANAENLNTVYNNQLAQPAQSALDERAKIRAEISKKAGALTG